MHLCRFFGKSFVPRRQHPGPLTAARVAPICGIYSHFSTHSPAIGGFLPLFSRSLTDSKLGSSVPQSPEIRLISVKLQRSYGLQ